MNSKHQSFCIQPARFRLDGGAMYGIIPKPLWEKNSPPDDSNRIDLALRLWVIKSEDKLVVIDTGMGDHHDATFEERFDLRTEKNPLENALNSLGFKADDVTDLVLSHLHFDHIGGIGHKNAEGQWSPVFKNASCHVHRQHYEYSLQPTARDAGSFHVKDYQPVLAYYEKMKKIIWHKGESGVLLDLGSEKLEFRCSHGHTPWLMHPYDQEFIYLADLIPTAHHISLPWVMGYDIAPGKTTEDKLDTLNFVLKRGLKIIFEHDVDSWGAEIYLDEKKGFKAKEKFRAQDSLGFSLQ